MGYYKFDLQDRKQRTVALEYVPAQYRGPLDSETVQQVERQDAAREYIRTMMDAAIDSAMQEIRRAQS